MELGPDEFNQAPGDFDAVKASSVMMSRLLKLS